MGLHRSTLFPSTAIIIAMRTASAHSVGRSPVGRIFIVGAVELSAEGEPRRIRLAQILDGASKTLHHFIARSVAPGDRGALIRFASHVPKPNTPLPR